MKNIKDFLFESITEFVNEANIEKGIDELVKILKDTILKDRDLTEDDFEDLEDGTFNLTNVPQDGKLADDFFRKRASILSAAIHTRDSKTCKEISLVQAGGHNIFVRVNLDDSTDTEHGSWKAGDIISLDMSKEIKDKLL